jgi:hypothetical protein
MAKSPGDSGALHIESRVESAGVERDGAEFRLSLPRPISNLGFLRKRVVRASACLPVALSEPSKARALIAPAQRDIGRRFRASRFPGLMPLNRTQENLASAAPNRGAHQSPMFADLRVWAVRPEQAASALQRRQRVSALDSNERAFVIQLGCLTKSRSRHAINRKLDCDAIVAQHDAMHSVDRRRA